MTTHTHIIGADEATDTSPSCEAQHVVEQRHEFTWFDTVWICVFVLFGLLVLSRSKADPDLWGHVQYGREVLRDGHLHEHTTWSYAVDDFRWVNHENIAELMMASADNLGGQTALLFVKSLLTLLLLGLPLWAARRIGAGLLTCFSIVVLISFSISFHWLVRPHMLSYVSAAALLTILATGLPGAVTARPAGGKPGRWWLWLIPPLMTFWTNSHGGYLAGMALLMAWLGLDAAELLLRRDSRFRATVLHHAALYGVTVAATMINPYGIELHTWMLSSLGRPRPEIREWGPINVFSVDGLPFVALLIGTFLCLKKSDQPKRWPGLIVMSLLAWQSLKHHRHLPFLALTAAVVLAPHIESLMRQFYRRSLSRVSEHRLQLRREIRRSSAAHLALPMILVVVLSVWQYPRQAVLHVEKDYFPVTAMQFMADNNLEGRVLVSFNWAQYALGVFADSSPGSRVAFDGRFRTCYPQHIIDMYFDFLLGESAVRYREDASGPYDPFKALDYNDPNLVLIHRRASAPTETMSAVSDAWCCLYRDSLAEIWGRRSIYDDTRSPQYFPASQRHLSDDVQEGSVPWPAFPVQNATPTQMASR